MIWGEKEVPSLKLTASLCLKMDGWNMSFLLGPGPFSGALAVGFREGMCFGVCRFITWSFTLKDWRNPKPSPRDLLPVNFSGLICSCNKNWLWWTPCLQKQRTVNTPFDTGSKMQLTCDFCSTFAEVYLVSAWVCRLVGGFNPSEKYWSRWESSPNRGENKKCLKSPASKESLLHLQSGPLRSALRESKRPTARPRFVAGPNSKTYFRDALMSSAILGVFHVALGGYLKICSHDFLGRLTLLEGDHWNGTRTTPVLED